MGSGNFTICNWFYVVSDTGAGAYEMIEKGAGGTSQKRYLLRVNADMKLECEIDDDTTLKRITGGTTLSLNTWYFGAGVRDGNNLRLYLGTQSTQPASDATAVDITGYGSIDSAEAFTIGAANGAGATGSSNYFDGLINNVRVYNAAIALATLQSTYKEVLTSATNLVSSWYAPANNHNDFVASNNLTASNTPTFSATIPFIYPLSSSFFLMF